jgi:ketosteroid isomerase-like protein
MDRLHERLLMHDMDGYAEIWAPNGTMEFPFAPSGWPQLRGREEVRAYARDRFGEVDITTILWQARHETGDPDVLVVEWEAAGTVLRTGRPYRARYVSVVKVGGEGIVDFRDYWSPLATGHASACA